jgi:hypothetical protein
LLLKVVMAVMAVGTLGMACIGRPRHDWGQRGH